MRGGDSLILAGVEDPNGPADMETPEELVSRLREAAPAARSPCVAPQRRR